MGMIQDNIRASRLDTSTFLVSGASADPLCRVNVNNEGGISYEWFRHPDTLGASTLAAIEEGLQQEGIPSHLTRPPSLRERIAARLGLA